MADIDQTNIYSYRGNSFMLDFEKYLFDHGITVDEIELMNGIRSWPLWLARAGFFGSTSAWAGAGGRTFAWGVRLGGEKMIQITDKIRLRQLDKHNIVVEMLVTGRNPKTKQLVDSWQVQGYYNDVRKAIKGILNNDMLIDISDVTSLTDYYDKLQDQVAVLVAALSGVDPCST